MAECANEISKDSSPQDSKNLKIILLGYKCHLTSECEFSTRHIEEIIRHIATHKTDKSEIKMKQQSSVSKSNSSTNSGRFVFKKLSWLSNITKIKPQKALLTNQELVESEVNDKNEPDLQQTTIGIENDDNTLIETLIKKTLVNPQIQTWIRENKNNPEEFNTAGFGGIKLKAPKLNAGELNAIKSIMEQLNAVIFNGVKLNVPKLNAHELNAIKSIMEELDKIESSFNDETYFNNGSDIKQRIGCNENDELIIEKLIKTILATPQIQNWIEKNVRDYPEKFNLVRFDGAKSNGPKLKNKQLNTEELNTIRSIVEELNENESNGEELNSNKLLDYIEKKLNQLIFKIDKMLENSKLFINYVKNIFNQIKYMRNSSKPQTKTANFPQVDVEANNEEQNLPKMKIKVIVYKTKQISTAGPVDHEKSDTMEASPSVQHPTNYRIVNVENPHCLLMVVKTQANGYMILKFECVPTFRDENTDLLGSDFMSYSVPLTKKSSTNTMGEEMTIYVKKKNLDV